WTSRERSERRPQVRAGEGRGAFAWGSRSRSSKIRAAARRLLPAPADDEDDLPAHLRLRLERGLHLGERAAHDLLELLRQLTRDGRRAVFAEVLDELPERLDEA